MPASGFQKRFAYQHGNTQQRYYNARYDKENVYRNNIRDRPEDNHAQRHHGTVYHHENRKHPAHKRRFYRSLQ
jgi:hypothetical protein